MSTLFMIDSNGKGTVSYLRFELINTLGVQRNVWTNYYPGQRLTGISANHHRNKVPGVSIKIEPLACDVFTCSTKDHAASTHN